MGPSSIFVVFGMQISMLINHREVKTLDHVDVPGSDDWNTALRNAIAEWYNDEDDIIMQTSGSTGKPQKITLSKANIRASAQLTQKTFDLKSGDTLLLCLPVHYIAGRMMVYRAIVLGLNLLTIEPSLNPVQHLTDHVSLASFTPMQIANAIDLYVDRLQNIDHILIGGAAVSQPMRQSIRALGLTAYESYGMTETITHVALRRMDSDRCFHALEGVRFSVDDRGCLVVHVRHLDQQKFITNDLVDLKTNKTFQWLGRIDHVINSGGIKIIPETVEQKIALIIPNRFFVHADKDAKLGEKVALIIEDESWSSEEKVEYEKQMRHILDAYEFPKNIYFLKPFKKTHTGKVNRHKTFQLAKRFKEE